MAGQENLTWEVIIEGGLVFQKGLCTGGGGTGSVQETRGSQVPGLDRRLWKAIYWVVWGGVAVGIVKQSALEKATLAVLGGPADQLRGRVALAGPGREPWCGACRGGAGRPAPPHHTWRTPQVWGPSCFLVAGSRGPFLLLVHVEWGQGLQREADPNLGSKRCQFFSLQGPGPHPPQPPCPLPHCKLIPAPPRPVH